MFKVKLHEDEYRVKFLHKIPESIHYQYPKKFFQDTFGTACYIEHLPLNEQFYVGWSHLSKYDQFDRSIGRKVSLTKALQSAFPGELGKPIRRVFWEAYYQARNEKW